MYVFIPYAFRLFKRCFHSYVCYFTTASQYRHIHQRANWSTTLYYYFPLQNCPTPSTGSFDEKCFLEMMAPLGYRAHDSMPLVAPGTHADLADVAVGNEVCCKSRRDDFDYLSTVSFTF